MNNSNTHRPTLPRVSVVVPCRNERQYIGRCVHALLEGTEPDIEIVVVDGESDDGTRDLLRALAAEDGRVVILDNRDRSTPAALNKGVRHARGEYIAILGAHSEPRPDWIERNLAALLRHPQAAAVGGVLETVGESSVGRAAAAVLRSRFGVGTARFRTGGPAGEVDTVAFGCYRRHAFREGLFDPELTTNQDDEFNTRLVARGERLFFDPSVVCKYHSRSSWRGLVRQYWRYGKYKLDVFRKAGRIGSARQLVPAAWVAFLMLALSLSWMEPWLRHLTAGVMGLYLALGTIAAAGSAHIQGARRILFVPLAASIHIAYGAGFWCGALRAMGRRAEQPRCPVPVDGRDSRRERRRPLIRRRLGG